MTEQYVVVADVMLEVRIFNVNVLSPFRISFVVGHVDCIAVVNVDRRRRHGAFEDGV